MKKILTALLLTVGLSTATDTGLIAIHTLAGAGRLLEETDESAGAAVQLMALGLEQGHDLHCKATSAIAASSKPNESVVLTCLIIIDNPEDQQ